MFKLVVLSALLAVAVARPWTSQDSSSLVYSAPLLRTAPVLQSYSAAPVLRSYSTGSIVRAVHSPLVQTYAASARIGLPAPRYTYSATIPAPLSYSAEW